MEVRQPQISGADGVGDGEGGDDQQDQSAGDPDGGGHHFPNRCRRSGSVGGPMARWSGDLVPEALEEGPRGVSTGEAVITVWAFRISSSRTSMGERFGLSFRKAWVSNTAAAFIAGVGARCSTTVSTSSQVSAGRREPEGVFAPAFPSMVMKCHAVTVGRSLCIGIERHRQPKRHG